ncbi:MAG: hypothetical protein ACM3TR_03720 [Caulobacteraceae bacterium]
MIDFRVRPEDQGEEVLNALRLGKTDITSVIAGGIRMLTKLTMKLEALIESGRIKTKWSEMEDYGVTELVHMIFDNDPAEDSVATAAIVEKGTVCLNLFEGIMHEHNGVVYTLTRAYIDVEDNIVFAALSGELFLYETYVIDAEDPKRSLTTE